MLKMLIINKYLNINLNKIDIFIKSLLFKCKKINCIFTIIKE